jgi:hypothetical protein
MRLNPNPEPMKGVDMGGSVHRSRILSADVLGTCDPLRPHILHPVDKALRQSGLKTGANPSGVVYRPPGPYFTANTASTAVSE